MTDTHSEVFELSDTLTKEQIDKIVGAHGADIRKALEDGGVSSRAAARPAIYPIDGRIHSDEPKSIGDAFVTSLREAAQRGSGRTATR
jgi:hypothetical protein